MLILQCIHNNFKSLLFLFLFGFLAWRTQSSKPEARQTDSGHLLTRIPVSKKSFGRVFVSPYKAWILVYTDIYQHSYNVLFCKSDDSNHDHDPVDKHCNFLFRFTFQFQWMEFVMTVINLLQILLIAEILIPFYRLYLDED